jgi:hypothetical protein
MYPSLYTHRGQTSTKPSNHAGYTPSRFCHAQKKDGRFSQNESFNRKNLNYNEASLTTQEQPCVTLTRNTKASPTVNCAPS